MSRPIHGINSAGPGLTSARVSEPTGSGAPLAVYRLSPRETQVAILSAEGLSADDMSRSLGIRVGTVRNIRRALRRKLDIPASAALNIALSGLFGSVASAGTVAPDGSVAAGGERVEDGRDIPGSVRARRGPAPERRVHLSVRQAIASVGQLAERLDARAVAVAGAAEHSPKAREQLVWEAEQLLAVADALHEVQSKAIARVRAHLALMAG